MARLASIRWTTNRVLATLALGLGVLALAGDPVPGRTVRVDTGELATSMASGTDRLAPRELADWIIRQRTDYRLIDVRDPAAFALYHIPSAENAPIGSLLDAGLARNERIVLVGDDGVATAQAWFLLRARRFTGVRLLTGGLQAWKDEVLYPLAPSDSSAAAMESFARAAAVARSFGGAPRRAGPAGTLLSADEGMPALPKVVAPAALSAAPGAPPAKKKKEGC